MPNIYTKEYGQVMITSPNEHSLIMIGGAGEEGYGQTLLELKTDENLNLEWIFLTQSLNFYRWNLIAMPLPENFADCQVC